MIPILVTGTLLILTILFAVIEGSIFQSDESVSKETSESTNNKKYDCP